MAPERAKYELALERFGEAMRQAEVCPSPRSYLRLHAARRQLTAARRALEIVEGPASIRTLTQYFA